MSNARLVRDHNKRRVVDDWIVFVKAVLHVQIPCLQFCDAGDAYSMTRDTCGHVNLGPERKVDGEEVQLLLGDDVKVAQAGMHDDEAAVIRHTSARTAQCADVPLGDASEGRDEGIHNEQ